VSRFWGPAAATDWNLPRTFMMEWGKGKRSFISFLSPQRIPVEGPSLGTKAGGLPQSKTWRNMLRAFETRERHGLRQSSAALAFF
jgi:hypothetical protein